MSDRKGMMVEIIELQEEKIKEFSAFVKMVFDEFVAVDYSDEGNRTFYEYIKDDSIKERRNAGNILLTVEEDGNIIGAIEIRDLMHISLLFVDKRHQGKGIGEGLIDCGIARIRRENVDITFVEVNSSPSAKSIYERMGFRLQSGLMEKNGIKYYEMIRDLKVPEDESK
jgi:GNAT superfamily N-acetyltransferase